MIRIFWDTNLYIYLFEGTPEFLDPTRALLERMQERGDRLFTSAMTLGEVQVKPLRTGRIDLAERYRAAIRQTSEILSFDEVAADLYAKLRENSAIKPQDAIQLSCAGAAGVDLFITNDFDLPKLNVSGIHLITALAGVSI